MCPVLSSLTDLYFLHDLNFLHVESGKDQLKNAFYNPLALWEKDAWHFPSSMSQSQSIRSFKVTQWKEAKSYAKLITIMSYFWKKIILQDYKFKISLVSSP